MSSFIFRKSLLQSRYVPRAPVLKRAYATHPEQNRSSNSNGVYVALAAAGGVAYYLYSRSGKASKESKGEIVQDKVNQVKEKYQETKDEAMQAVYGAKDRYDQAKHDAKEKYEDMKDGAMQAAYGAKDRYDQAKHDVKEAAGGKVDEAKSKYEQSKDDVKEAVGGKVDEAKSKYEQSKDDVMQKAGEAKKEGEKHMDNAKEKGQELQEKAGEKVKETGESIKQNAK